MTPRRPTCTSCRVAYPIPGRTLCPQCAAAADLLRRITPALQQHLDNHPAPRLIEAEMRAVFKAIARLALADTGPMFEPDDDPDSYPLAWAAQMLADNNAVGDLPQWDLPRVPTARRDTRVRQVLHGYARDELAPLLRLVQDTVTRDEVAEVLLGFCSVYLEDADASQGRELTIARLAESIEHGQELADQETP